jgi:tetratricopeptide (TPR) repeat protein
LPAEQPSNEEQKWRHILESDANNIEALANLGKVLFNQKQFSEALIYFEKAYKLAPQDSWILFHVGLTCGELKQFAKAISYYERFLEIEPDNVNVLFNLGIMYGQNNDWSNAEKTYRQVLEFLPTDISAWLNLGYALEQQSKIDEAIETYKEALTRDPTYGKAYFNLGQLLTKQGRKDEAIKIYRKAIENNPFSTIFLQSIYNLTGSKRYIPWIIYANQLKHYEFGDYSATIVGDIQASGQIGYKYIMLVYKKDDLIEPIYYLALESSVATAQHGDAQLFFCAFDDHGHVNFGLLDGALSVEDFAKEALVKVAQKYNLPLDSLPI